MHPGKFRETGEEVTIYDSWDEVTAISLRAPRYCQRCGAPLQYASFYDSINRFTLKGYCPTKKCGYSIVPSLHEEAYEKHMLDRWAKLVKERAFNRCEMESKECDGELHAHHIIPKGLDPSKMFDVENGLCLCAAHHKKIHSYM